MLGKSMIVMAVMLLVGLVALNVSSDPTHEFSIYRQLIEAEMNRQFDSSYQPAILIISRDNIQAEVRTKLYDFYSLTAVQLRFADSADLSLNKLAVIDQRQKLTVHSFVFGDLHYRYGWPGLDVTYLSSGGKTYHYTTHLKYDGQWRIVEKVAK